MVRLTLRRSVLAIIALITVVAASSCQASVGTSTETLDDSSMTALLGRIPLAALDEAAAQDTRSTVMVTLGDYNAASELAGIRRPSPTDVDASIDWIVQLTRPNTERVGAPFSFIPHDFPDLFSLAQADEDLEGEYGFSPLAIDTYATLTAPPVNFAVFGSEVALSSELEDVGQGVLSLGQGDDYAVDLESRTAGRSLGRPHRFGSKDDLMAVSLSTPLIQSWLGDSPSLASDTRFASAAAALDSAGVVNAVIVQSNFAWVELEAEVQEQLPSALSVPFDVVGIGIAAVEEQPASVIVYVFDSEADAAAAVPELDTRWRDAVLFTFRVPVADFFTIESVEQSGTAVVVTATIAEQGNTTRALDMLYRLDPLMSHS